MHVRTEAALQSVGWFIVVAAGPAQNPNTPAPVPGVLYAETTDSSIRVSNDCESNDGAIASG